MLLFWMQWFPTSHGNYSMCSAWDAVRTSYPIKDWHSVVWHKKKVPRWAFIHRLSTLDGSPSLGDYQWCNLYSVQGRYQWNYKSLNLLTAPFPSLEDYLFFDRHCGRLSKGENWLIEMLWSMDWVGEKYTRGMGFQKSILKLSLSAAVYNIWGERNMRIFQLKTMDACSLSSKIINAIKDSMLAWRKVRTSSRNRETCKRWNVPHCILEAPPVQCIS